MAVEVILVPRSSVPPPTLEKLCTRFRTARLRALREDPNAFASSYERESQFAPGDWKKRLQNPDATTFVAICPAAAPETGESPSDTTAKLAQNEWLGMIVLMGPRKLSPGDSMKPWKPFLVEQNGGDSTTSTFAGEEITYFAVSLFVSREMRRRGLGRRLIEAGVAAIQHEATSFGARKLTVGLALETENNAAMELYRKCGFELLPHDPTLKDMTDRGQETSAMARVLHLTQGEN